MSYVQIPRQALEDFLRGCGFSARTGGKELVYVRPHHKYHFVQIKVWTSLPAKGGNTRGCGQDAIRVTVAYEGDVPYRGRTNFGLQKFSRVYRTGSVESVLDRLYDRMQEAYRFANQWVRRNWTLLPK